MYHLGDSGPDRTATDKKLGASHDSSSRKIRSAGAGGTERHGKPVRDERQRSTDVSEADEM